MIERAEVFELQHDVQEPRGPSPVTYHERRSLFVRIEDSDGAVGWGETYAAPGVSAVLRDLVTRVVGRDGIRSRSLRDEIAGTYSDRLAVSAVAIALEDLRARAAGVSVAALYGGSRRTEITAYASSGGYSETEPGDRVWYEDTSAAIAAGFTACKLRIGRYPAALELPVLEKVRSAVGDHLDLMVDANGAYTAPDAVAVGRALGQMGFRWLEEPLIRTRNGLSYPGYETLPPALDIAVAGGEGLSSRSAFAAFLQRRAVDIVQPDVSICGGIGEALFVAELAALWGSPCAPHAWGGAVTLAATVQLASLLPPVSELATPDFPLLEYDLFENPMRTELLAGQLSPSGGVVTVPDDVGLGIVLDEAWIRRSAGG